MSSFSPRGAMILSISLVIVAGCDGTVERQREATRQALWKAHATATQRVLVKQVEVGRSTAEAPFSAATSWIEAAEMQAIDLSGCPSDFASAFQDYCAKLEDVALCAEIVEQAAEEFESGSRMIRDTKTELARKVGAVREALRRLRVVASGYTNSMDGTMRNAE